MILSRMMLNVIIACFFVVIIVLSILLYTTKISLQNERKIIKEYTTSFEKENKDNGNEMKMLKEKYNEARAMNNVLLGLFKDDISSELFAFTVSNAKYEVAKSFDYLDTNDIKIEAENRLKDHLKQIKPGYKYTVTFPPQGTRAYPEGERLYSSP